MVLRSSLTLCCCIGLAACTSTKPDQTFLINAETSSPILEVATPRSNAECARRELHFSIGQDNEIDVETCDNGQCVETELADLRFFDRSTRVNSNDIGLGGGSAAEGPVIPVEGPDGLLWLCREDEAAQECICIPWAQD